MIIFDGQWYAQQKLGYLKPRIEHLRQRGMKLVIAAILFVEDTGSQLYTSIKRQVANEIGIEYRVFEFSMVDPVERVLEIIDQLNQDNSVTGVIIQKPWRKTWLRVTGFDELQALQLGKTPAQAYQAWWGKLTVALDTVKDVDGLHPSLVADLQRGIYKQDRVLPATCQAVLEIMILSQVDRENWSVLFSGKLDFGPIRSKRILTIGATDLLGIPLHSVLRNEKCESELIGSIIFNQYIEQKKFLYDFDIIVSATGHANLIKGEYVSSGCALIDVSEPKPDVDVANLLDRVTFLTPVPGGVGPVTVACLMENCVRLAETS